MLIGNPEIFAIESFVNKVYPSASFLALGYFSIHISSNVYGVRLPEASMLGCSFNSVQRRVEQRGSHLLPSVSNFEASVIAESVQNAIYSENPYDRVFDMSREDFMESLYKREILWAPDGDEAFDDGSHVLQIDEGNEVRLIAFVNNENTESLWGSVSEIYLSQDDFYNILEEWVRVFQEELKIKNNL